MDPNVERRIRDRAYAIWEEEGRPAGRDVEHWLRAAEQIASEERGGASSPDAGEKPKRARSPRSAAKPAGTESTAAKSTAGGEAEAPSPPRTRRSKNAG